MSDEKKPPKHDATHGSAANQNSSSATDEGPSNPKPTSAFDLSRLRRPQNFHETSGVKRVLTMVPVRKPNKHEFFRVYAEENLQTFVLRIKGDRDEVFLVDPDLWSHLASEVSPYALLLCVSRQGVLFIWPLRLPAGDGRQDSWAKSAIDAAEIAKRQWIRIGANMSMGGYDVFAAEGQLGDPEWGEKSFSDLIELAFKEQIIRDLEHDAIQRLRGKL